MINLNFPSELLTEMFKHFKDDYKTTHSCTLVNKQWHSNSIRFLWGKSIVHKNSLKIIINCLLEKEKDLLAENDIKLNFNLLGKPPLHNYAKFIDEIDVWFYNSNIESLIDGGGRKWFKERLLYFILDHSLIKSIKSHQSCQSFVEYCGFNLSFQNLRRLECCTSNGAGFFHRLAGICKNIQMLDITVEDVCETNVDRSLARLIKAQNEIRELVVASNIDMNFSNDFKKAISVHSKSIASYFSNGNHDLESLTISSFKNLTMLVLRDYVNMGNMKKHFFPNLEHFQLSLSEQEYLTDLIKFIKKNGRHLKYLTISGNSLFTEEECIGELIRTIGEYCPDLEHLATFYRNEAYQHLANLLYNCDRLEAISFNEYQFSHVLDGDKILAVLNQILPENLKSLSVDYMITMSDSALDALMKNWRGTLPFTMNISRRGTAAQKYLPDTLLIKYRDLGFLKIITYENDANFGGFLEPSGQIPFFSKVTLAMTRTSRYLWRNFFDHRDHIDHIEM